LEDILDSHILQGLENHVDHFTQLRGEINMKDIHLLSQQSIFNLEEENHLEEGNIDFETTPNAEPTDSQAITDFLKEEELPLRESLSENFSGSREAFNSLNSSTYYHLYPNLFNCLTL
jgi:hypothetical protein